MSNQTQNDKNFILNNALFIFLTIYFLILGFLLVHDSNVITGICALVGVAIPLFWQRTSEQLKEQKGVEAFIKSCDVITNSNLTNINDDLLPVLEIIQTDIELAGDKTFFDLKQFHESMKNNLDIGAYNEFLNSGLYYHLDNLFQGNLFFSRELIKNASVLYSRQVHDMVRFEKLLDSQDFKAVEKRKTLSTKLINQLEVRLKRIVLELNNLKVRITKYRTDIGLPEDKPSEVLKTEEAE